VLAGYSASKSAAWSYTNALRIDLRDKGIQVLGVHAGYIDTELSRGVNVPKSTAHDIAVAALQGLQAGAEEVLTDDQSRLVKATLSTEHGYYLDPT
jgi:short-subunit dehydrogenase